MNPSKVACIQGLVEMGKAMEQMSSESFLELATKARMKNAWFTFENVRKSWTELSKWLTIEALEQWTSPYTWANQPKNVGLVLAGNIPMVGFHDVLSVLVSGHKAYIKMSSDDSVLMAQLVEMIHGYVPEANERVFIVPQLKGMDAMIATGSNNTARYFEYYFRNIPHIIRKNRSSVAILDGSETEENIQALGEDIFSYFGLGCRNVGKLYLPKDFDFQQFFPPLEKFAHVHQHHKYVNNYDYYKSIYLVNKEPFYDNGFLLLRENASLHPPVAVLYYELYETMDELSETLKIKEEEIQCITSKVHNPKFLPLGKTQSPTLTDYADGVDTLGFLAGV